jgi:hypothetical protein
MVEGDRLRGIQMDHGEDFSLLSVREAIPRDQCEFCATADRAIDGVVVFSGSELEGVLVVPQSHVDGLEDLSVPHRANLLAAVQRATREVSDGIPVSGPKIEVLTDRPGSLGHIGIHVMSRCLEESAQSVPQSHQGRPGISA